jgi:calcineurin-like phosphoesterase family protein/2'-5' RNA ligase
MAKYLIEFRFHGKAKYEIKKLVHDINKKYKLSTKRTVPHITLVGPFNTNNEKNLIQEFESMCKNYSLMDFEIDGFNTFENTKVIYLEVKPSEILKEFRWILSKKLQSFCNLNSYDYEREFIFHSTIAMKLPNHKYSNLNEYVKNISKVRFKHKLVRVTLLKNGLILREYDFLLKKSLKRNEAKSKQIYLQSMKILTNKLKQFHDTKINFLDKFLSYFFKPKIFITSDLHLGHTNIIKYCKRPFKDVKEMNSVLVKNWNNTIANKDIVYFLGDLAYGKNTSTDYWYNKLKGQMIFIKGNHDISNNINFYEHQILEYKNISFYLCHDPKDVPSNWKGWIIYGHHHNNNLIEFPFFDRKNKRINVSVELTNYEPVNMDDIVNLINSEVDFKALND